MRIQRLLAAHLELKDCPILIPLKHFCGLETRSGKGTGKKCLPRYRPNFTEPKCCVEGNKSRLLHLLGIRHDYSFWSGRLTLWPDRTNINFGGLCNPPSRWEGVMKGMVFKAFENHVLKHLGEDMLDELLDHPQLSSKGAYTSVGNYPSSDMGYLVTALSERTGMSTNELTRSFGFELFEVLADKHANIMSQFDGCLDMLAGIESVIHRDVRKLYSDAELPRFDIETRDGERQVTMVYRSTRPFADLAHGLILGALARYGIDKTSTVTREDLSDDGTQARFAITVTD